MDCKRAEKLLVEYLYQELTPRHTVDLERHLEVCDACSGTLENWRAIHRGYQKTNEDAPPVPYLSQRILAAAKEELQRKPSFSEKFVAILRPALILPVLIFALIATLMLYKQEDVHIAKTIPTDDKPMATPDSSIAPKERALDLKRSQPVGSREITSNLERDKAARLDKQTAENLKSLGYITEDENTEFGKADELSESRAEKKLKKAPADYYEQQKAAEPSQIAPQEETTKNESYPATAGAAPISQAPAPIPSKEAGSKDVSFEKAQLYFRSNNLPQGQVEAKQAIQNDKSGELAAQFHDAGRQYQNSREPEQAIVQYNLVLNNYPKYTQAPEVLLSLAESYEQIGEYDQALKAYEQLSQYPKMKGTARQRIGEMQKRQKSRDQLRTLGYVDPNKKD